MATNALWVKQVGSDEYLEGVNSGNLDGYVTFRYRTYKGSRPKWVSPGTTNLRLDDALDVTTFERGEVFEDLWVTDFNQNFYKAHDGLIKSDDITVQAWFQTSDDSEYQTLFSNTQGGGFSLKIHNGRLRGLYRTNATGSKRSLIVRGKNGLTMVSGIMRLLSLEECYSTLFIKCVYISMVRKIVVYNFRNITGPKSSGIGATVGAEPNSGGEFTHFFKGQIYAVNVHNYAVHAGFLKGRFVRDGSRYFNMPSYHDFLYDKKPNDLWLKKTIREESDNRFTKKVAERFTLPFNDDKYVAQGISIENKSIYVSYYYNAKHLSDWSLS